MSEEILLTGACGYIGQHLIPALFKQNPKVSLTITDIVLPSIPAAADEFRDRIVTAQTDLTSLEACAELISRRFSTCYLLHGIMSAGAEADLDLGLKINVDSHRYLLDILRKQHKEGEPPVKVVFPSSLAAYGPTSPGETVSEETCLHPQSSYGCEKAIVELLVNDFSRKGLIDGRVCRLPTIIVRPGKASTAASSFMSGIVREPLRGQKSVLPVPMNLSVWICSTPTVVQNLIIAKDVPKERFGLDRTVNLPGQTVRISDILDALEEVGGQGARDLVEERHDPNIEAIVGSWPDRFDVSLAMKLGMQRDVSLLELVKTFANSQVS